MSKLNIKYTLHLFKQAGFSIIMSSLLIGSSTFALSQANLEFFARNGIYYYDPSGSNVNCTVGSMMNYAGAQILSSAQQEALQANQPFYEAASAKVLAEHGYNLPWQVIATLHYKEHGLQRDNPANGQGAYQLYSYTGGGNNANAFLPAGPISDEEFQRQTDLVAELVATSYGSGLDLTNSDDVKRMFFKYNGAAQQYYDRAIAMGFSDEEARNGEGSTYVMNRYDARRDPASPEMSPLWEGRFTHDGQWDSSSTSDKTFGAFVVYEALGGSGFCSGELVSGGMTYEQAYEFIENYVNNPNECYEYSNMCDIYDVEPGGNCSTFSSYFLGKYTTLGKVGLPNGRNVVSSLANNYGLPTGNEPQPYAIFSTDSGSTICSDGRKCGHTGVVLGIDEANNEIYIGQMGYGSPRSWGLTVIRNSLDKYRNGSYTYAYTDSVLKMS